MPTHLKSVKATTKSKAPKATKVSKAHTSKLTKLTKSQKKPKAAKIKALPAPSEGDLLQFVENLKRQWMSTIDALVDPLMIVGKDYRIKKANLAAARMGDVEVKEIVGRKCYEVFAARTSPCAGCKLKENSTKTETSTFELENVRTDRFFEVTSQPFLDANGAFDGMVHVYRDRTDAKRMQEQLSQQEKLASIGLLAGGIAHEINNPLGGILIFSQMLLRELPKDSSHYEDVVEIEAATQRCKVIVESLLDFARQNPSSKKLAEVNVVDAIRTAMRFGKVAAKQGAYVDIQEDFQDDAHFVIGDRNRLIQLFLNLFQNAIQAMPDGGTLTVRGHRRTIGGQDVCSYEVEDSGVGIPPENIGKIFDPFFTTKDPGEGTGLGLALCYGIVQDLGGKMGVESTVNVGTRFLIELPAATGVNVEKPAS